MAGKDGADRSEVHPGAILVVYTANIAPDPGRRPENGRPATPFLAATRGGGGELCPRRLLACRLRRRATLRDRKQPGEAMDRESATRDRTMTPRPADAENNWVVTIGRDGSLGDGISRKSAHMAPGVLHLAVSVQVVDPEGRWLLQRRAATKEAFADCWANTCCTHPHVDEDPGEAAVRRLSEELGLAVPADCLVPAGVFVYRATDEVSGFVEHEVDHVFVVVAPTDAAATDPDEISELVRLAYPEALALVTSDQGAPWAAEVIRRSFDVLDKR